MAQRKAAAVQVTEPGKAERVEQERARLMELFTGADQNKLDFIRDAVQQVAWLGITILELQADVDEKGPVLPYQNGRNQTGYQANPACKLLTDCQKLYNTQFRALLPLVPDKGDTDNTFLEFNLPDTRTEEEKQAEYERQMEELRQIKEDLRNRGF